MKLLSVFLIALLAVGSGVLLFNGLKKVKKVPAHIHRQYASWKQKFGKLYATPAEQDFRLEKFAESFTEIEKQNSNYNEFVATNNLPPLSGPMFALQQFSDLTKEEFKKKFTGLKMPEYLNLETPSDDVFKNIKKRSGLQAAYQTKVRNQQSCGSCWAFATIAVTEKYYYDNFNIQLDLSQQDLVDCDTANNGCDGGWPTDAMNFIKNNGIAKSSNKPYTSASSSCTTSASLRVQMGSNWGSTQYAWTQAIAQKANAAGVYGAICVYSSGAFQNLSNSNDIWYASSSGECSNQVDHAVTEIGAGSNYVTVLNSWDTTWGYQGTKMIAPCASNNILGTGVSFMHPYSNKALA